MHIFYRDRKGEYLVRTGNRSFVRFTRRYENDYAYPEFKDEDIVMGLTMCHPINLTPVSSLEVPFSLRVRGMAVVVLESVRDCQYELKTHRQDRANLLEEISLAVMGYGADTYPLP